MGVGEDVDGYGGGVAGDKAVGVVLGESVSACEAGVWRVGEGAVGGEGEHAVGRAGHKLRDEGVAGEVGVCELDVGADGGVDIGVVGIVAGGGWRFGDIDLHGDGGRGGGLAVGGFDGEGNECAGGVGRGSPGGGIAGGDCRCAGDGGGAFDCQCAAVDRGDEEADRQAAGIRGVGIGEQLGVGDGERSVLGGAAEGADGCERWGGGG